MFFGDYIDSPVEPLFPFGHGLSYTTFEYAGMAVRATDTRTSIEVSFEVRNTGERAGEAVVQLYCRDLVASVARPDRMLVGFCRVHLQPGETQRVTLMVHPSRLAFYDPQMRFVVEPGEFVFSLGASSADMRAEQTVSLVGEVAEYLQREVVATRVVKV